MEEIYKQFKDVADELLMIINDIQQEVWSDKCIPENNYHFLGMDDILLELIIKMCDTFKEFPSTQAKDMIRDRIGTYDAVSYNASISNVVWNNLFNYYQNEAELNLFATFDSDSKFVIRKQLDMSEELRLTYTDYGRLIKKLSGRLRPSDIRKKGEYIYYVKNDHVDAKKVFMKAMEMGDEESGNLLMKLYSLKYYEIKHIADFGNADACFYIAQDDEVCNYEGTLKYLVIAASKKHKKAIKALGSYYYDKFLETQDKSCAEVVLKVFKAAEEIGSRDVTMFGKMAYINYSLEDYREAVKYAELSKTGSSYHLLGVIYENGNGCAVDKKKALKNYEAAVEKGYMAAQVQYEKLSAEIAAQAQKNVVKENTSYASTTTYTSSYYSSYYGGYYSGW